MTCVLLTGGLGYIGSHIAVELLNSDIHYNIIIIDNLLNSSKSMLDVIKNNKTRKNNNEILFIEMDVSNKNKLELLFTNHKIDIVVHLAGLKSVNESVKDPMYYYNNNLISTINLIETMKKYNCKNMVFSSSSTVYGNNKAPFNEHMVTGVGITNPYGKTKFMQEEFLKDLYYSDNTWNIVILRYFNPISQKNKSLIESPNGIPNNIFPYIVKVYNKELETLQVYGNNYGTPDGTCVRDFIHVVDLADAHIKACEYIINNNNIDFKIYNLGTGVGVSVQQLLDSFEKVNHTKINYKYANRREGDIDVSYSESLLVNRELKWVAKYNIDDMVLLN
jgi:UDP-glucose 4-epimerase